MRLALVGMIVAATAGAPVRAQPQQPPALVGAQFDVVSIKLNKSGTMGGGGETLPDGTQRFINRPVATILAAAAPGPIDEVFRDGLPDWTKTERYDIIAKPAPDSHPTREERREMLRNMLVERFKVVGHIQEVERTGFALVLARTDGRLGPQLKKSTLDCAKPEDRSAPPMSLDDMKKSCGAMFGIGTIDSGGMTMDQLANGLRGRASDGLVINRTGLEGFYSVNLRYSIPTSDPIAQPDDAPSIFTAVQEQLGLKLVPEKTKVKIFVVDHIERPTPN